MKVAAVNQRDDSHRSLAIVNLVADDGGILFMEHANGLLDAGLAYLIAEPGDGIGPKLSQVLESLWMNRTGILVIAETNSIDLLIKG